MDSRICFARGFEHCHVNVILADYPDKVINQGTHMSEMSIYDFAQQLTAIALDMPVLIVETAEPSPQERLASYLAVASRASEPQVMETAFALALRTMRSIYSASTLNTMPTALKLKACETPMLALALEYSARSPQWQALIVRMMHDNVETGTGHLSVNRAKQAIKDIAKQAGYKQIKADLTDHDPSVRKAAIIMLGWLKNEKCVTPLLDAYDSLPEDEKQLVIAQLQEHYMHKLPFYLKWRVNKIQPELLALITCA